MSVALSETIRNVTGCMRATKISHLYKLTGIASPNIKPKTVASAEG